MKASSPKQEANIRIRPILFLVVWETSPGLAFFALSLIHVRERRSYPIMVEQMVHRGRKGSRESKKEAQRSRRKEPGRPKAVRTGIRPK